MIKAIKRGIRILSNPKEEFGNLNERTLESVVSDYIQILVLVAIVAGASSLIYSISRSIYIDLFLNVDMQYLRMINYSFGRSTALIFFYIFAGTFLLFFLSIILKPFLRNMKYISLLKIIFYSVTPLLFFSWLVSNPVPFVIWSLFLMVIGIRAHKSINIKEDSIHKRE